MGKSKEGWAPMRLMRCMSLAEFKKYMAGETLRNLSTHQGQKTDAIGFCFFHVSRSSETIEERIRYLAGIVSLDCVCVFATRPGTWLTRATGYYRNIDIDMDKLDKLEVATSCLMAQKAEYCTTVYDKGMLSLIAVGKPYWRDGWHVKWVMGGKKVQRIQGD